MLAIIASATSTDVEELDRTRRDIDPHSNDLHCVDVSTYEMVMWDEVPRKKCTAKFPKVVKTKSKNVSKFLTPNHFHSTAKNIQHLIPMDYICNFKDLRGKLKPISL